MRFRSCRANAGARATETMWASTPGTGCRNCFDCEGWCWESEAKAVQQVLAQIGGMAWTIAESLPCCRPRLDRRPDRRHGRRHTGRSRRSRRCRHHTSNWHDKEACLSLRDTRRTPDAKQEEERAAHKSAAGSAPGAQHSKRREGPPGAKEAQRREVRRRLAMEAEAPTQGDK